MIKLDYNVITPTTKGEKDVPISSYEIVNSGLMTQEEWDYVSIKALELFSFGQETSEKLGLILADTKYEFGKTSDGNIILIDEIHTCDSSRFWIKDTYEEKFKNFIEPDKLDKDVIRDWIKNRCDPYNDDLPNIPNELIRKTSKTYEMFYSMLTKEC